MVNTDSKHSVIPPLENGDRLTRHEFERRYAAMPDLKKAELIEGIVYMPPAALRFNSHGNPHGRMITWLGFYEAMTLGVAIGDAPTVRLDTDNAPQPDAVLMIRSGGQARLSSDDYVEGAPELVVEIAASSVAIDLHAKKTAYRRNGIQEYIVWSVLERKVDWFYLHEGEYLDLLADADGVTRSRVFPGLWLAIAPLLAGEMQQVLTTLQTGLRSPEHQTFVEDLAQRAVE
jgi:Uma2 family endonuclease